MSAIDVIHGKKQDDMLHKEQIQKSGRKPRYLHWREKYASRILCRPRKMSLVMTLCGHAFVEVLS